MGWMITDSPQVTASVDTNSGDFAADFSAAGVDIGPNEMAQVQYQDGNGNVVLRYLYPSEVFRVVGWNHGHCF